MVIAEGERVAAAALDGALNPALSPAARSATALKLIDAVDPQAKLTATLTVPSDPEGVSALSLAELDQLALQAGLDSAPA